MLKEGLVVMGLVLMFAAPAQADPTVNGGRHIGTGVSSAGVASPSWVSGSTGVSSGGVSASRGVSNTTLRSRGYGSAGGYGGYSASGNPIPNSGNTLPANTSGAAPTTGSLGGGSNGAPPASGFTQGTSAGVDGASSAGVSTWSSAGLQGSSSGGVVGASSAGSVGASSGGAGGMNAPVVWQLPPGMTQAQYQQIQQQGSTSGYYYGYGYGGYGYNNYQGHPAETSSAPATSEPGNANGSLKAVPNGFTE